MTDEYSRSRTSTGSSAGAVRRRGKSRPGSPRSTASFPKTWAARKWSAAARAREKTAPGVLLRGTRPPPSCKRRCNPGKSASP